MKDVRDRRDDDERENGTNGDGHKGTCCYHDILAMMFGAHTNSTFSHGIPRPSS